MTEWRAMGQPHDGECDYLVWSWGDIVRCVDCGTLSEAPEKAKELKQKWMKDIDTAIQYEKKTNT